MQFIKQELKKYSDLESLNALENTNKELYVASLEQGIPCLIVNGYICDSRGIKFPNNQFQEEFGELAKRFSECKLIGIGILVDSNNSSFLNYMDINNILYSTREVINYKPNKIGLIVYNGLSTVARSMPYKTIYGMMNGMIKSLSFPYGPVKKSEASAKVIDIEKVNSSDVGKIKDIIIKNSILLENTLIIDPEQIYPKDNSTQDSYQIVSFNLNKVKRYKIVSFKEKVLKGSYSSMINKDKILESITINVDGSSKQISFGKVEDIKNALIHSHVKNGNLEYINLYGFTEEGVSHLNLL